MTAIKGTTLVWREGRKVSRRLTDEFDNGKEYYALHGKTILLPGNPASGRPQNNWFGTTTMCIDRERHPLIASSTERTT